MRSIVDGVSTLKLKSGIVKVKKLLYVVVAFALVFTGVPHASAVERVNEQEPVLLPPCIIDGENKTREEIDQEIEEYIISTINSLNSTSRVQSYYSTLKFEPHIRNVEGYAGNQPSGGTRFPTGGGFFYSENGGPEQTVSISVSLPFGLSPYSLSVGVGLGNKTDTFGEIIFAPSTDKYYKLYVEKQVEITPIGVYLVESKNGPVTENSKFAYMMESVVLISKDVYAKEV